MRGIHGDLSQYKLSLKWALEFSSAWTVLWETLIQWHPVNSCWPHLVPLLVHVVFIGGNIPCFGPGNECRFPDHLGRIMQLCKKIILYFFYPVPMQKSFPFGAVLKMTVIQTLVQREVPAFIQAFHMCLKQQCGSFLPAFGSRFAWDNLGCRQMLGWSELSSSAL